MKKEFAVLSTISLSLSLMGGCLSASEHASRVQDGLQGDRLTVGRVQREIRTGMTVSQVAEVLGAPNIVSTDEERREVWIYDKIAFDKVYSSSSGGVSSLIFGIATGVIAGGAAGGNYSGEAGAVSTNQRTLTVVIKFDKEGKVRDFAYHSSSF